MAKYYPEVYYSKTIQDLLKKEPPFRSQPDYPSRPEQEGCSSLILPFFLISGAVFTIIGIIVDGEVGTPLIVLGLIATAILTLVYNSVLKSIKENQFQNSPVMWQYKEAMRQWERERGNAMTSERLRIFREQCYASLGKFKYDSSVYSDMNSTEKPVQIGASESFFLSELSKSGLFNLHGPMHVIYYQRSYYPDIVISSSDGKILFDIEIDEPYAFEDGSPIHYLNEEGYSIDSERNEAFVAKGFCVVRFSEEQIIRHTQRCIDYLQAIINSIKSGNNGIPKPPSDIIQAKWSLSESRRMASTDYRRTYLPSSLQDSADVPLEHGSTYEPHTYADDNDDLPF